MNLKFGIIVFLILGFTPLPAIASETILRCQTDAAHRAGYDDWNDMFIKFEEAGSVSRWDASQGVWNKFCSFRVEGRACSMGVTPVKIFLDDRPEGGDIAFNTLEIDRRSGNFFDGSFVQDGDERNRGRGVCVVSPPPPKPKTAF